MKPPQVAAGVYRLGTAWVNSYLYVVDEGVVVIDCGFPGYYERLPGALDSIGHSFDSVLAIVLTHYHDDHVGAAERIRTETGAPVYAPVGDAEGIRRAKVPMPKGLLPSLWRPRMIRYMAHAGRNRGMSLRAVAELRTYEDGDVLAEAGGLRVVHTPGHTAGHCSLLAERADLLFAGDAIAMFSFFTGDTGPQLIPFHENASVARDSLSRLESLPASTVAVGHGEPFEGTPAKAVKLARA